MSLVRLRVRAIAEITSLSFSRYVSSSSQIMIAYRFLMQEVEMVWKSFKKVKSRKPAIVTPFCLFDQLQVNINFILRKICFHRDLSRTPDSLRSPLAFYLCLFILHIGLLYKKNRSHWFKVSLKILETVPVEKKFIIYHCLSVSLSSQLKYFAEP